MSSILTSLQSRILESQSPSSVKFCQSLAQICVSLSSSPDVMKATLVRITAVKLVRFWP